jgi:F0F1-type ATP synthase alpha subunit
MYALLYSANEGVFDELPLNKMAIASENLLLELQKKQPKLVDRINSGDKVNDQDNEAILKIAKSIADSYNEKPKEGSGSNKS